jgi:hypothetical protein
VQARWISWLGFFAVFACLVAAEDARSAWFSRSNIVREGQVCSATDLLTDPLLDPVWGVPGPDSPTIDRGQPGWAVMDLNRVRRDALPDIGAYEYIGT